MLSAVSLRTTFAAAATALCLLVFTPHAHAQPKDAVKKEQLQQMYVSYLKEEGFRSTIDSDGDVQFKRDGRVYFIQVIPDDPQFFRVVLPGIMKIEGQADRRRALAAADAANARSKAAKVFTVRDHVWVSVETFMSAPEDFKGLFMRMLAGLDNGAINFALKARD